MPIFEREYQVVSLSLVGKSSFHLLIKASNIYGANLYVKAQVTREGGGNMAVFVFRVLLAYW